jgi:hypothetical protein
MYTAEDCRRKADQHWEMAGLARQDGDTADADRHTRDARLWESRAQQGGYDPVIRYRISYDAGGESVCTAHLERIKGAVIRCPSDDHAWRLGSAIFIDTDAPGDIISAFYNDGFDEKLEVCILP